MAAAVAAASTRPWPGDPSLSRGLSRGLPPPPSPPRVRLHCCFALPLIHFTPALLRYSVPLFLKRPCDRTLPPPPPSAAAFPSALISCSRT
jgi:hypothetical protein